MAEQEAAAGAEQEAATGAATVATVEEKGARVRCQPEPPGGMEAAGARSPSRGSHSAGNGPRPHRSAAPAAPAAASRRCTLGGAASPQRRSTTATRGGRAARPNSPATDPRPRNRATSGTQEETLRAGRAGRAGRATTQCERRRKRWAGPEECSEQTSDALTWRVQCEARLLRPLQLALLGLEQRPLACPRLAQRLAGVAGARVGAQRRRQRATSSPRRRLQLDDHPVSIPHNSHPQRRRGRAG